MSRILVLFASNHGQTRLVAAAIVQQLRARGATAELGDLATWTSLPEPDAYDAVVLGSRVEYGKHAPALFAYVGAHREALAARPIAFFSVSMAAARPLPGTDPEGYVQLAIDQMRLHPAVTAAFGGGLPYRQYGWLMRFVMRRIARSHGDPTDASRDHSFTDWEAVRAFADRVAYVAGEHVEPQPATAAARS